MNITQAIVDAIEAATSGISNAAASKIATGNSLNITISGALKRERVQQLIEEKGLSVTDMAKSLGISPMTLFLRIENGGAFTIPQATALASILGVPLEEIYQIKVTWY